MKRLLLLMLLALMPGVHAFEKTRCDDLQIHAQKINTEDHFNALQRMRIQAETILLHRLEQARKGETSHPVDINKLRSMMGEISTNNNISEMTEKEIFAELLKITDRELISLLEPASVTAKNILSIKREPNQFYPNRWDIIFNFDRKGSEAFADLTQSIAGTSRHIVIVHDNQIFSAAIVPLRHKEEGIWRGSFTVEGGFDKNKSMELYEKFAGIDKYSCY